MPSAARVVLVAIGKVTRPATRPAEQTAALDPDSLVRGRSALRSFQLRCDPLSPFPPERLPGSHCLDTFECLQRWEKQFRSLRT
jgi:hypothetical protein